MASGVNHYTRSNRGTRARCAGTVRTVYLPATDIDGRQREIVELDEFVVAALRPANAKFADHDGVRGCESRSDFNGTGKDQTHQYQQGNGFKGFSENHER